MYNYVLRSAKKQNEQVFTWFVEWTKGAYWGMKKELLEKIENIEDERLIRTLFYIIAGYEKKSWELISAFLFCKLVN